MKNFIKTASAGCVIVAAICFISFLQSCYPKEKCSISCENGGVCNEKSCSCPIAYTGVNCEIVVREKYLGSWSATSTTGSTSAQYMANISSGSNIGDIEIRNLYGYFITAITAYVSSNDSVTIPNQQASGKIVAGTGHYTLLPADEPIIVFSYTVTDIATNVVTHVVDTLGN